MRDEPQAYVDALSKMTDYETELTSVGRNDAPELLWSLWHLNLMPHEEFRRLLPIVWCMAEYPTSSIGTEPLVSDVQGQWIRDGLRGRTSYVSLAAVPRS